MSPSWPLVPLEELLQAVSRPENVIPERSYRILGAHWYAHGLYVKNTTTGSGVQADRLYRVQQGDFVYNRLFAWKGSFALATNEHEGCYVSNEFPCFTVDSNRLDGRFLWRYFSRPPVWDHALAFSKGGTPTSRNRLKEDKFLAFKIPLPPLDEQRRIVARIEALAAKIDEARGLREGAVQETELLLPSTSSRLFASVDGSLRPTAKLGSLASRITKGESPEWQGYSYQEEGTAFIRSENVLWGRLELTNAAHITDEFHRKLVRSQLRRGDVLINLVGASIGRSAVYKEEKAANINQAVAVISPNSKDLDSEYLMRFLNGGDAQRVIHGGKVETARPNISLGDLNALEIPVAPISEQRRIVAHLSGLQAKVDTLKRLQAEIAAELEAMLPSILDKAFKGEL